MIESKPCKKCIHHMFVVYDLYDGNDKCMRNVPKIVDPISGKECYRSRRGALNCDSEREIRRDLSEYIVELLFGRKRDKCKCIGRYFDCDKEALI